ncbi:vWA domain-containing protein [Microbacterium marinilacus]|uniref:VWFA domain-containing protein n=1 Tax=Microbacterium marinilacus TaxID=415209 RepID=A0ABP7BWE9_9MICO|nr:VWA domain-containing protein [Microbacterium marinilacus]MBY0688247.1 VWA domain-containing protein [Microbacterium marinilacus]
MILQPVLHPLLLLALCAPVACLAVLRLRRARRGGERLSWALRLAVVIACAVLALRPGLPGGETRTLATETDVVLLVDTTASIVAEDWGDGRPRLEGVREDVEAIVEAYPGARFALITFDSAAEVRLPLTTDTSALRSALEVLTPEVTQQSRGSSIGVAHQTLAETLEAAASASPDRSRMVFYLGDGEQTAESPPESFDDSAALIDDGAVLGYGTHEGGPMKTQRGGVPGEGGDEYILDGSERALSIVDEAALEGVAAELGVGYQHRTAAEPVALPEAPTSTVAPAAGEVGDVVELGWMVAIAIAALLAIDAAVVAGGLPAALAVARPPRRPARGSARGPAADSAQDPDQHGERG